MADTLGSQFSKLRSFFWPIHRHEAKKVVPMLMMLFLICFNYSILRNMKDSVVITASGAEVIPFIKVWAILPMAVLATFLFTKLSSCFSQEKVVYIMISGFLAFFMLFAFVLHPYREQLHLHGLANYLEQVLPQGMQGMISMTRYWSFTAFYVMAELWSSIVLTVLFWGFANEITKISEAGRFYGVMSIASNISAIIAGQTAISCSRGGIYNPNIPFGHDAWEQTLMVLLLVVFAFGIATMAIFWWMNRTVLEEPSFQELHATKRNSGKGKKRLSLRESIAYLSNSKYLICIAIIVVSYSLIINLVEVLWKDQLKELYPSPADYNWYMSRLTSWIGVVSTIIAFFMPRIISGLGWTKTALITPIIMLFTSAGFFSFLFFQDIVSPIAIGLTGVTPLAIAVFFGGAQNCLSKAAKYSVFDATKEMAYIPLGHECKLRGKAAIDGVGYRFGKSGGSLIHQGLLMVLGTLSVSAPIVAGLIIIAIVGWMFAVKALGKQFNALVSSQDKESKTEVTPRGEKRQLIPAEERTATA